MPATRNFPVQYGQLAAGLRTYRVRGGTTVEEFCKAHKIQYGASVKVMGRSVTRNTVLKPGDIITSINAVQGGI